MGVRFGTAEENVTEILPIDAATVDSMASESEIPLGEAPSPRTLQSTVGLVWRALLLWMFLLLLLSLFISIIHK